MSFGFRHVLGGSLPLTTTKRGCDRSERRSTPAPASGPLRPRAETRLPTPERELHSPSRRGGRRASLRGRARNSAAPSAPVSAAAWAGGRGWPPPCVPRPHLSGPPGRRPHLARGLPRPLRRHGPGSEAARPRRPAAAPSAGRTGAAARPPSPTSGRTPGSASQKRARQARFRRLCSRRRRR